MAIFAHFSFRFQIAVYIELLLLLLLLLYIALYSICLQIRLDYQHGALIVLIRTKRAFM